MSYVPTSHVLVEQDGPVTIITLNNPDMRNAFLDDMHESMQTIWHDLAVDNSVRAVVITGAGKAFSAGGDIPGFIRNYEDIDYRRASLRGAKRLMDAMAEFPKPLVSAVNGAAVGLGCNVALLADLVLIGESAFFADTHVAIGLVAGDGGAAFWPLYMGMLKAKEYIMLGDRIPAKLAVEIGLANRVVADADLMPEALKLAHRLAALPRQAVQETKRALNIHIQSAINLVAPFALSAEGESFATDDIRNTIEGFKKQK